MFLGSILRAKPHAFMAWLAQSDDEARAVRNVVAIKNDYFYGVNIDPTRIYAFFRPITQMWAARAANGNGDRPMVIPDSAYFAKCLGVASVDMATYSLDDSKRLAHKFKIPIAFLLSGKLVYEGREIAPFQPGCQRRAGSAVVRPSAQG
jgi:hypothetical protein